MWWPWPANQTNGRPCAECASKHQPTSTCTMLCCYFEKSRDNRGLGLGYGFHSNPLKGINHVLPLNSKNLNLPSELLEPEDMPGLLKVIVGINRKFSICWYQNYPEWLDTAREISIKVVEKAGAPLDLGVGHVVAIIFWGAFIPPCRSLRRCVWRIKSSQSWGKVTRFTVRQDAFWEPQRCVRSDECCHSREKGTWSQERSGPPHHQQFFVTCTQQWDTHQNCKTDPQVAFHTEPVTETGLPRSYAKVFEGGFLLHSVLSHANMGASYASIAKSILAVVCSGKGSEVHVCFDKCVGNSVKGSERKLRGAVDVVCTAPDQTMRQTGQKVSRNVSQMGFSRTNW